MKIIEKGITEIKPFENNPRKNDNAVAAVANSIKQFGFKQPIVIDKNDIIVAGHTRFKAAIQLGLDSVPCIMADDLTDEEIKAYRLADNKTGELADWNFELLDAELKGIENIDMTLFGFEAPEEIPEVSDDEDFEPEMPSEPITKPGDIWQLGDHRLMCGDSTILTDFEKLMGGVWPTWSSPILLTVWQSAARTKR